MLRRYIAQILSIYNYFDGLVVVNKEGVIEYFITYRPDINDIRDQDVIGKHVLEVYPELTEETSSCLKVLKEGKPIFNQRQELITHTGHIFHAENTTMPIVYNGEIIGVVDVSRYLRSEAQRQNITISFKENTQTKEKDSLYRIDDIITNDLSMLEVKDKILKVSKTESSVLIYGATGTGKELVAQAIHRHSDRHDKPFVSLNCAAIPATLLESTLFGTVKGSYTGAENKKGLFEIAHGGTLFLDEINSMEIVIQAKILKVIEEQKMLRVGGLEYIDIDVRVVTAVNEMPWKSIKDGKLREDLFYRLSVVQINLPTLKERKNDIKILTGYFIDMFNRKMGRRIIGINEEVEDVFNRYTWPGNVRELKNVIEGAFNLATYNVIELNDLPDYILNRHNEYGVRIENFLGKLPLKDSINNLEKEIIKAALEKTNNMVEAAKLLKISKQLLKYKIDKYELY
jgi:arginine utilization regulatory protein